MGYLVMPLQWSSAGLSGGHAESFVLTMGRGEGGHDAKDLGAMAGHRGWVLLLTAHFSCKTTFGQLQATHRYPINLVTSTVWTSGSLGDTRLKSSLTKINLVRKSKTGKPATLETHWHWSLRIFPANVCLWGPSHESEENRDIDILCGCPTREYNYRAGRDPKII